MTTGERNIEILNKLKEGATTKELAKVYKLSEPSIRAIKRNAKQQGLGDMVEDVLNSKPLAKITEAVKSAIWNDGEDCGCDERKAKLNKLVSNWSNVQCMTETMYADFEAIRGTQSLRSDQRQTIAAIHAHVFSHKLVVPCSCAPRKWLKWMEELEKVYQSYQ